MDNNEKMRMNEQLPMERIGNFDEVALGLTEEQATAEAKRCIQCKKPLCVKGCPVMINIPAFLKLIAIGDFQGAITKIKEKNSLPAICGRVCPQEDQCEKACVLGKKGSAVGIGYLERFVADREIQNPKSKIQMKSQIQNPKQGKKVAVVGSGPAGLTAAADLAKFGYDITLFESLSTPGGVLVYGIPQFRLPKEVVKIEVDYIRALGVDLQTDVLIGQTITIQQLFDKGYKAVFVGSGAGLPSFMGIPGENLPGVYSANEFLTRVNLMKANKFPEFMTPVKIGERVAVIGAGNVAMDAARVSLRLGAKEVTIVYRRSRTEMPARAEEIIRAEEEGVKFQLLTAPTEVFAGSDGKVAGMECFKMELGEPDASGRRRPVPVAGSEFNTEYNTVISAIGQSPNPLVPKSEPRLKIEKWGGIIVNKKGLTTLAGVYAGGDIVTGAATVITAMGAGKVAAASIHEYLSR